MRLAVIGTAAGLAGRAQAASLETLLHPLAAGAVPAGVEQVESYARLREVLEDPRLILLDLPLGAVVDTVIDEVYLHLEPGDVVIDATGSYWCDTLRRFRRMRHRSIFYVDAAEVATAGGRRLVASGDRRGVELALPVLERLAAPGRAVSVGEAGAAHYVLMIQEALATAAAEAAGEACQLLEACPAVQSSAAAALLGLDETRRGARAAWLLDDAVRLEAAVPLLAQAIMLGQAAALEEERSSPPPPRIGPFVHPDDIL
jgi:6-phosphogluconate dehydrogenase (decarboxylating)